MTDRAWHDRLQQERRAERRLLLALLIAVIVVLGALLAEANARLQAARDALGAACTDIIDLYGEADSEQERKKLDPAAATCSDAGFI